MIHTSSADNSHNINRESEPAYSMQSHTYTGHTYTWPQFALSFEQLL